MSRLNVRTAFPAASTRVTCTASSLASWSCERFTRTRPYEIVVPLSLASGTCVKPLSATATFAGGRGMTLRQVPASQATLGLHASLIFVSVSLRFATFQWYVPVVEHLSPLLVANRCAATRETSSSPMASPRMKPPLPLDLTFSTQP